MSDITNVFKATVKTVRAREKALGLSGFGSDKYIFPPGHRAKSDFASHAQEVVGISLTYATFGSMSLCVHFVVVCF